MPLQELPRSADRYGREQRREIAAALAAVRRLWRRMDGDFDASWMAVEHQVLAVMQTAQLAVAEGAVDYVPNVLADTGQRVRDAEYMVQPSLLVGTAGDGRSIDGLAYGGVIRTKTAVGAGLSPRRALEAGGKWLSLATATLLSDTARTAEKMAGHSRHVTGYVRMLEPPSCDRCVILAGKRTGAQTAFQRHPRCDCRNIPASESVAGDLAVDPRAYADSLTDADLAKFFGSEDTAQAYRDGADIYQLVNAQRGGVRSAQVYGRNVRYTTEGWTRQGFAWSRANRADVRRPVRLMPESIYQISANREEALRLLRLYGWVI